MAKIFINYTSKDRLWAQWIGVTLRDYGHTPFVHEWEIGAGENIPRWMDEKIKAADRLLGVFSDAYTQAIYSGAERAAAFWQDPQGQKGFLVPVEVETVTDWPRLTAPLKRLSLVGLTEVDAEKALIKFLRPPAAPKKRPPFPGRHTFADKQTDLNAIFEVAERANAFQQDSESLPATRPALPVGNKRVLSEDKQEPLGGLLIRPTQEAPTPSELSPPNAPPATGEEVPSPRDHEAFESWLRTKPLEWSVVIAARAALRVLPFARTSEIGARRAASITLPIFRATAIVRFVGLFPCRATDAHPHLS